MSESEIKEELNFDEFKRCLEEHDYKIITQQKQQESVVIEGKPVALPFSDRVRQVILKKNPLKDTWTVVASGSMTEERFLLFLKRECIKIGVNNKWEKDLSEKIRNIDIDKLGEEE